MRLLCITGALALLCGGCDDRSVSSPPQPVATAERDAAIITKNVDAQLDISRQSKKVNRPEVVIDWSQLPSPTASESDRLDNYVGADRCGECHAESFQRWFGSTHGQAGGLPNQVKLKAPFDGQPIQFRDATVYPEKAGESLSFRIVQIKAPEVIVKVDAVVGGGHLHGGGTQAFFTRSSDGHLMLLPFDYSVTDKRWFCQSRRDGRWTPISPDTPIDICEYPPNRHLGMSSGSNCQNCHGSQIELVFDRQQRRFDTAFTSLSVNCESCHGPGRAHSDKKSKESFDDLGALDRDGSVAVCFRCHADKAAVAAGYLSGADFDEYYSVLHLRSNRDAKVDVYGRVQSFSYQESHLWSDCYRNGSMTCVDCHDPHTNGYRDIYGTPLKGRFDDGQCTGCHPSKGGAMAQKHHRHGEVEVRCTDCHMPYKQHPAVGRAVTYQRSDHSISIPREIRVPWQRDGHGCAHCHQDKSTDWLNEGLKGLFGALKPVPPGTEEIAQLSRPQPRGGMAGPTPPGVLAASLTSAERALEVVQDDHRPLLVRALSAVVEAALATKAPSLTEASQDRILALMNHESHEIRAAATAVGLVMGLYHRHIAGKAWQAMKAVQPSEQTMTRRHVIFNLLAVLLSFGGSNPVAQRVALNVLMDDAFDFAAADSPAYAIVAGGLRKAELMRESVEAWRKALSNPRLNASRYPLDQAGSRSKILFGFGRTLADAGEADYAVNTMQAALKDNPEDRPLREAVCARMLDMGQKPAALECLEGLTKRNPRFAQGYFIQAQLHTELKQYDEAIRCAVEGLKVDPNNSVARQKLRAIQQMKRQSRALPIK